MKAAINRYYVNKVRPFEGERLALVEELLPIARERWGTSPAAVEKALANGRFKVDDEGQVSEAAFLTWAQWRHFGQTFRAETLEPWQLAQAIFEGYAFMPLFRKNWRKRANFLEAWHIALDFDTKDDRSRLDTLLSAPLSEHAALAYTSPSHTQDAPKARLVFIFDAPISDVDQYEKLYRALQDAYPAADRQAKDAARLFYGSQDCEMRETGRILPIAKCNLLITRYEARQKAEAARRAKEQRIEVDATGDHADYVKRCLEIACQKVAQAGQGERHTTLLRQARIVGGLVGAEWAHLGRGDAFGALFAAAESCGEVKDSGAKSVRATIDAGLDYGKSSPWPTPAVRVAGV